MKRNEYKRISFKKEEMYTVNLCRCPYCGSCHYEVGFYATAYNCKCLDCGSLFWWDFTKE